MGGFLEVSDPYSLLEMAGTSILWPTSERRCSVGFFCLAGLRALVIETGFGMGI